MEYDLILTYVHICFKGPCENKPAGKKQLLSASRVSLFLHSPLTICPPNYVRADCSAGQHNLNKS